VWTTVWKNRVWPGDNLRTAKTVHEAPGWALCCPQGVPDDATPARLRRQGSVHNVHSPYCCYW
jgi:hypothetical protein